MRPAATIITRPAVELRAATFFRPEFRTFTHDSFGTRGSVNVMTTREGGFDSTAPLAGLEVRTSACASADGASTKNSPPASRTIQRKRRTPSSGGGLSGRLA